MTPERLEELLRTRPSHQRTYNREFPDLEMHCAPVRASGLPFGWGAAVLVVGLVAVVGAAMFGPWHYGPAGAKPSAAASASPQEFSATGSMKEARQLASATLLEDGRVLVVGGNYGDNLSTDLAAVPSAELYDPATGKFTVTGSPHMSGFPITSVLLKSGRVLVIGCDPSGSCLSSLADVYDPSTGLFTAAGPITGSCVYCTATLLNDGRVLIGRGADLLLHTQPSLLFDPATDTFATTGSMTIARTGHTATLLSDGRVLIAGGSDGTTSRLASAELYDPRTGTFSPTGSMATVRNGHTATLLSDGRVLIAGGSSYTTGDLSTLKSLASAELYDPKTGTFSPTGSMTIDRAGQTATLLSDGRVLIAGGDNSRFIAGGNDGTGDIIVGNVLALAELYDPKTGTFKPTGPMTSARIDQTATLLSDGRVLIVGGSDSSGNPLSSAELYQP